MAVSRTKKPTTKSSVKKQPPRKSQPLKKLRQKNQSQKKPVQPKSVKLALKSVIKWLKSPPITLRNTIISMVMQSTFGLLPKLR